MNFQPPQRAIQQTDEELLCLLTALRSPDSTVRVPAEAALEQAQLKWGFAGRLAAVAAAQGSSLSNLAAEERFAVRQLSLTILKRLALDHWNDTSTEDQTMMKTSLTAALADEDKRLRGLLHLSVANVLFRCKDWPELFAQLQAGIVQGTPHDAICCVECAKMLLDECGHESKVTSSLGPLQQPMLRLAASAEAPPALRRQCVATYNAGFVQVLEEASDVAGELQRRMANGLGIRGRAQKGEEKRPANPVVDGLLAALPEWVGVLAAMCTGVNTWSDPDRVACGFSAVCAATKLCRYPQLEEVLASCVDSLLRPACLMVQTVSPAYEASVIFADDDGASEEEDGVAELVAQLMELLQAMLLRPKLRALLKGHVRNMLQLHLPFMRITAAQERAWRADPNEFLAQEEDEHARGCLIRRSGEFMVNELLTHMKRETSKAVAGLVEAILEKSDPAAWKSVEVGLLVFGHVAGEVSTKLLKTGDLSPVVPKALGIAGQLCTDRSVPELLRTRAFSLLWKMRDAVCAMLPGDVPAMLQASAAGLAPTEPVVVRVSACRVFVRFLTAAEDKRPCEALLLEHGVLASLASLLKEADDELLHLFLESLCVMVKQCPGAMISVKDDLATLVLDIWRRSRHDPLVHLQVLDLVSCAMGVNEQLHTTMETRLLPAIAEGLAPAGNTSDASDEPHVVASAIELYSLLLKKAAVPLSAPLWSCVEPLISAVLQHDESGLLQNACDALCLVVRRTPAQLAESGLLAPLLRATEKLLGPELSDDGAAFVGPFISLLLSQFGSHLSADLVAGLLRALVVRLERTDLPFLKQELLVVFGRILNEDVARAIGVLQSLEMQNGGSGSVKGFEVLMSIWLDMAEKGDILARRAQNVSVSVFCQLHASCASDAQLSVLRLRNTKSGEVGGATLIQRLLLATLVILEKKNERYRKKDHDPLLDVQDSEDDDEDDDDLDDEFGGGKHEGRLLSELLDEDDDDDASNAGLGCEGDSFQELEQSDPLYALDLQKMASTYFSGLSQGALPPELISRIAAAVTEAQSRQQ